MNKSISMNWNQVLSHSQALELFSEGNFPLGNDIAHACKTLDDHDRESFYQFYVDAITHDSKDKLWKSFVIESCLQLTHYRMDEEQIESLIKVFWGRNNHAAICKAFIDSVIVWEKNLDLKERHKLFPFAVALVCEFGIHFASELKNMGLKEQEIGNMLDPVGSYLISLTNINDSGVRLALLRYFATLANIQSDQTDFGKIMNRFGHSVLFSLLNLLSDPKVSHYATSYILEHFHLFLILTQKDQRILHQTFRNFMLKDHEMLISILRKLSKKLKKSAKSKDPKYPKAFEHHLGALLSIAAELSRSSLAWNLLELIEDLGGLKIRNSYINAVLAQDLGNPRFQSFLRELANSSCKSKSGQKLLSDTYKSKKTAPINLLSSDSSGIIKQISGLSLGLVS